MALLWSSTYQIFFAINLFIYKITSLNIKRTNAIYDLKGEFNQGEMHGRGRYVWSDGVIYEVSAVEITLIINTSYKINL